MSFVNNYSSWTVKNSITWATIKSLTNLVPFPDRVPIPWNAYCSNDGDFEFWGLNLEDGLKVEIVKRIKVMKDEKNTKLSL